MKKALTLLIIGGTSILIVGCSKESKTLTCSITAKPKDIIEKRDIIITTTFSNNKIAKVTVNDKIEFFPGIDEYLDQAWYDEFKLQEAARYMIGENATINLEQIDLGVEVDVSMDVNKYTTEEKKAASSTSKLVLDNNYKQTKKAYESDGYNCK